MTDHADLAILGARVVTDDSKASQPVHGLAVRHGRIVALGDEHTRELMGPRTQVIHATDGLILPGFQDAHVHAPFAGRNRLNIWLNDLQGRSAYLDHIAHHAHAHPEQTWLVGGGWAMAHFPGGTPRKEDLDAIVPDRPVFLMNRVVHGAWLNSKALEIAGITAETPDPPDGRIERDPRTGEPSGTLHEGAAYSFNDRHIPAPSQDEWERAILNAQSHLHSLGITGWQDAWVTPATLAAYRSLSEARALTARVVGAQWWDRHRELEQIPEFLAAREKATVGNFHPSSVKIMTDGVMENYTGALLEPYCDGCGGHTNNTGLSYVEQDLLDAAVTDLDRLGFQVHMHAIGDRAARNALDALAAARQANGVNDNRHHIAHLQLVAPEDISRFKHLNVTANLQTYWAQSEPQMDELTIPFLGRERSARQFPFADLHRSGAHLAMGSDWSVTTANPLAQIEVAVTRVDPGARHQDPFLPEQKLALATAVRAFTCGSAHLNHDTEAGVLQMGKRADIAVLDRDIFQPAGGLPADATITHTVAAGELVYRAL